MIQHFGGGMIEKLPSVWLLVKLIAKTPSCNRNFA
jgi:hypothetical protein